MVLRPSKSDNWQDESICGVYYLPYRGFRETKAPPIDMYLKEFLVERSISLELFKNWQFGAPNKYSSYRSVLKYFSPLPTNLSNSLLIAKEWATQHFMCMGGSEVVFDVQRLVSAMNLSSGVGYPYNRENKVETSYTSPHKAFKDKREFCQDLKWVEKEFTKYRNYMAQCNRKPIEFYTNTAKKELLKLKKILANKFRTYTAAGIRNTMLGIALMGIMNAKLYDSWQETSAFIGGSTFYGAWNKLYQRLNRYKYAFMCDESSYDATLHPELIYAVRDVMFTYLQAEYRSNVEIKNLWNNVFEDIVNSLIIMDNGDIFVKSQGNPSGSFNTIVTNTIVLYMLFCMAWIDLGCEISYSTFDKNVLLALCGDDNLGTIADESVGVYNVRTISRQWLNYGIVTKAEAVNEGKLVDMQFLSHKFRIIQGFALPVPDSEKAVCTLLYKSRSHSHIRWAFLKACAIRITTFWDVPTRNLIQDYLSYLLLNYSPQLKSKRNMNDPNDLFTWEQVYSVYKSDQEIAFMYWYDESYIRLFDEDSERILAQEGVEPKCIPEFDLGVLRK